MTSSGSRIQITAHVAERMPATFEDFDGPASPARDQVRLEVLAPAELVGRSLVVVVDGAHEDSVLVPSSIVSFWMFESDFEFDVLFTGALDGLTLASQGHQDEGGLP